MPQYKVIFQVDLLFPPNRITKKNAYHIFTANEELEIVKENSDELIPLLTADIESQFKTAKVFGLDIIDLNYHPKKSQSKEKVNEDR